MKTGRLVIVYLYWACLAFADRPIIRCLDTEAENGWASFAKEIRNQVEQPNFFTGQFEAGLTPVSIDPILLSTILVPGEPIQKYGAYVTELVLVCVTCKHNTDGFVRFLTVIHRAPYESRRWECDVTVTKSKNGMETVFPNKFKEGKHTGDQLIENIRRIVRPGICFTEKDFVIAVTMFDDGFAKYSGFKLSEKKIRLITLPEVSLSQKK